MNCHYVQNLISAYIDCEMDVKEKRILRQHLFACPECNREYQEILKLKEFLENMTPESCAYNPMITLRTRLTTEERSLFRPTEFRIYSMSRVGLVGACLLAFFLSTILLFPKNNSSVQAVNLYGDPSGLSRQPMVPAAQGFSIDESMSVYQASLMIP